MNSFILRGIGYVPNKPEIVRKGQLSYVRFPLMGQDKVIDEETGLPQMRRFISTMWFAAFGGVGDRIARYVGKGDHLLVEARLSPYDWTDAEPATDSGCSWVVIDFRSGAFGVVPQEAPPLEPIASLANAEEAELHVTAAAS